MLIEASAVAGVFKLPLPAVFEQGGKSQVWVIDPVTLTVRAQAIAVLGAEGNLVLVGAGLANGLRVVTAGVDTMTPGQQVRLYVEPGAAIASPRLSPVVGASTAVAAPDAALPATSVAAPAAVPPAGASAASR